MFDLHELLDVPTMQVCMGMFDLHSPLDDPTMHAGVYGYV